jgi:hypothetical protein
MSKSKVVWDGNKGTACASDLGWGPGQWPTRVSIEGEEYVKGKEMSVEGVHEGYV